jgi:hypothetical protein
MATLVGERVFQNVASTMPVRAKIFSPEQIGSSLEWQCKIVIEGLAEIYERSVVGGDSFQALYLALRVLCSQLEKHESRLRFLDGPPGDIGLPLIVPWDSGPILKGKIYRMIQEQVKDDLDSRR